MTFSSPWHPDWPWGPHSLLFSGYQGFFPLGNSGGVLELTSNLHLAQGLRMSAAVPSLPHVTA